MTTNNQKKKITPRLKIILSTRGLSQREFAEMVDMEVYQISNICSGRRSNILLTNAKKIASALQLSLDEVFGD